MKPELCVRAGLFIAMLAAGFCAVAEDFAPGVQHICIPNAARDGWDCGTIDNPPKPAVVEEEVAEEPAPQPPPFLMNPEGPAAASETIVEEPAAPQPEPLPEAEPQTPIVASEPTVSEPAAPAIEENIGEAAPLVESEVAPSEALPAQPAPIEPPTAEPAAPVAVEPMESEPLPEPVAAETETLPEPEAPAVAAPEPEPTVVQETVSTPAAEPAAEPAIAEPAQPSAVDVADAPVSVESMPESEPVPVAEPEPVAAPAAKTRAAPAPINPAPAPVASTGRLYLSSLQGARDFAKLPSAHFTLQLAHAPSAEQFPALIQQLGIDHRQCYVLRVRRDDGDWFVLAYGSFADANTAKAALMQIRPAPGMTAVWPRRVGYLQGEYRP
jgi:hypothetical protein